MHKASTSRHNRTLAEQAYALIRKRILQGQLPLGATIRPREFAAELGMSLVPISQALQRLKNEFLIETAPRAGTRVRVPTPQDIRGFYVVREALESQSARLFCMNASPAERQELKVLAERLDSAYKECVAQPHASTEQLYALRDQHMKFHLHIAHGARCPFLSESIEKNQILIFNWFLDRLFGSPGLPVHWHTQLADVLAVPDPEAADRAMRNHVRFRMDELLVRLEPFYSLDRHHLLRVVNATHPPRSADGSVGASPPHRLSED